MQNQFDSIGSGKKPRKYRQATCYFCKIKIPENELQEHFKNCDQAPQRCSNGCGSYVQRRFMARHLEEECVNRKRAICRYCGEAMTAGLLQQHYTACMQVPVPCPKKCQVGYVPRKDLERHIADACDTIVHDCTYSGCNFQGAPSSVEQHFRDDLASHLSLVTTDLLGQREEVARLNQDLETEREYRLQHVGNVDATLMSFKKFMDEETQALRGLCSQQQRDIQKLQATVAELRARLDQVSEHCQGEVRVVQDELQENSELHAKVDSQLRQDLVDLKDSVAFSQNHDTKAAGHLLWKIGNFQAKMEESKVNETSLHSPEFYSSIFGYRLRLEVHLNGFGMWKGRNTIVSLQTLAGEFDSLLDWPFKQPVTITLRDQTIPREERKDLSKVFTSKPKDSQPSENEDTLVGYHHFIPHKTLESRQYIKDDALFLEVRVDRS